MNRYAWWKYLIIATIAAAVIAGLWYFDRDGHYKYLLTAPLLVFAAFFAWIFYLSTKNTRVAMP